MTSSEELDSRSKAESGAVPDLQIIRSKLGVPRLPLDIISRQRLVGRLESPASRVVLISAPAGSGKTVLVQDWIQGTGTSAAWLSLDSLDNERARFLAHLGAALSLVGLPGNQSAAQGMPGLGPCAEAIPHTSFPNPCRGRG